MTESDKRNSTDALEGDRPEDAPEWAGTIVLECPKCKAQFKSHDLGDLAGCPECKSTFERFDNIVEGDIA